MCIFSRCNWQEIARTYAPPVGTTFEAKGSSYADMATKALLGYTTVLFQCPKCKAIRREEMLGKPVDKV